MRAVLLTAALVLASCAPASKPVDRRLPATIDMPLAQSFGPAQATRPTRSNAVLAADILDLTFRLESGRELAVLSRFEGPIGVRVTGAAPPTLIPDLEALLGRLRAEAGLDIRRVAGAAPAGITIEALPRATLQGAVQEAACFVVPQVSSWGEFRRNRRSSRIEWANLVTRDRLAIFVPADVSPQEIRDCLHEELAQAIGPPNDLYRLPDSVFNDDNLQPILTGFDMLVLRAIYAPALRSGMSRAEVAARLPGVLDAINPAGRGGPTALPAPTPRRWIDQMETVLSGSSNARRRAAARQAVAIARDAGWRDNRHAFALYALGRLSIDADPELAMRSFLQARALYATIDGAELQEAHVAMQLAAFALSAGQPEFAIELLNRNLAPVSRAQNAALLSLMLMVKAAALEDVGRAGEAVAVREDALGWGRYGFASDLEVQQRLSEITALRSTRRAGTT